MSTRRAQSMPPAAAYEKAPRGRCLSAICVSWKVFTCVLSHVLLVALVVAYCWMGAITFEHLEAGHEREVSVERRTRRVNSCVVILNYLSSLKTGEGRHKVYSRKSHRVDLDADAQGGGAVRTKLDRRCGVQASSNGLYIFAHHIWI